MLLRRYIRLSDSSADCPVYCRPTIYSLSAAGKGCRSKGKTANVGRSTNISFLHIVLPCCPVGAGRQGHYTLWDVAPDHTALHAPPQGVSAHREPWGYPGHPRVTSIPEAWTQFYQHQEMHLGPPDCGRCSLVNQSRAKRICCKTLPTILELLFCYPEVLHILFLLFIMLFYIYIARLSIQQFS